jgi:hypothetical protein
MQHTRKGYFAIGTALALWCGMLLCLEIGRRIGIAQLGAWGPEALSGTGPIDGAVFGLLALLLGFSFNGAANRFDRRRQLLAEAANSADSAWQRIDLLPTDQQAAVRPLFSAYLEAVLAATTPHAGVDPLRQPAAVRHVQDTLWSTAVSMCTSPRGEPARMLLLPSLSEMFGAVDRGRMMRRIHPPMAIVLTLSLTELVAALFGGYSIANTPTRNWFYIIGFATAIALVTFVIIDLEHPRAGFVRIDAMDQELVDLRDAFRAEADRHATKADEIAGANAPAVTPLRRRRRSP